MTHQCDDDEDEEEHEGGHEDGHDDPVRGLQDVTVQGHPVLDEVAGCRWEEGTVLCALGVLGHHFDVLRHTHMAEHEAGTYRSIT